MAWSDRQVAMLRAMGLRTWQPAAAPAPAFPPAPLLAPLLAPLPAPLAAPVAALAAAAAQPVAGLPSSSTWPARQRAVSSPSAQTPPTIALAPRADALTLDWPALREAVAACRACSLCETRQQTVFGVGHPKARWMVIGDAPDAQEDAQGEPFVGAAGQLLDNMLRALGLSRAGDADPRHAVYIANTLKCRPPGNRNPAADEMARCEPFLMRQITLLQPRLILAMGRFAIQALLRSSEPVGRLRGRVHSYQGVPLVVTYHPAYLLRTPGDKARAWDDLCLAASVMDSTPP
jgi:uracil-DNA glycosylase